MTKHKSFRAGFLGVGEFAHAHLKVASYFPDVTWVGCYDNQHKLASAFAEQFRFSVFEDAPSLVENCDILFISAPELYHYELIDVAIRAGKHIMVTRPFVNNYVQADHIRSLVREANVYCCVFTPYRVHPCLHVAKQYIQRPIRFESRAYYPWQEMSNKNLIYHGMIHQIDLVLSLVSSPIKNVKAQGFSLYGTPSPDVVSVDVNFFDGESASFVASRVEQAHLNTFRMYESQKYVEVNFDKASLLYASADKTDWSFEKKMISEENQLDRLNKQCVIDNLSCFLMTIEGKTPMYSLANEQNEYKNLEVATLVGEQIEKFMHYTQ